MIEIVKIVEIEPVGPWRLRLRFSDGSEGVHDFASMVAEGGEMVAPLKDQAFFAKAHIEYGVPTWPNGFDIDAIALHMDMKSAGELHALTQPAAE
ncbi:MAG: DUF2442 domain-containing protein [Rhizomicrobium sp.]